MQRRKWQAFLCWFISVTGGLILRQCGELRKDHKNPNFVVWKLVWGNFITPKFVWEYESCAVSWPWGPVLDRGTVCQWDVKLKFSTVDCHCWMKTVFPNVKKPKTKQTKLTFKITHFANINSLTHDAWIVHPWSIFVKDFIIEQKKNKQKTHHLSRANELRVT